jgi:ribosome-associated toxin RatA of RatAB toxin-antitoxin module
MPTLKVWQDIAAPQSWLFDLSQDYGRRLDWDPFPEHYSFHSPHNRPQLGASLTVRARNGYSMDVRYISYHPPTSAAFEMLSGPWFFSGLAGTWRFVDTAPALTTVWFNYHFEAKPWLLRPVIEPLIKRSLLSHARARILALKAYAEAHYSPTAA